MVRPHAHAHERNTHRGGDHHRVAEDRLPGEDRNDLRHERERRDDQDVDFRVAEDPEEMHPERGRPTGLRVEEMAAEVAIDEQHQLRRRQRGQRQQRHPGHHQIEPGEQGHAAERHARAPHADDGGDEIDGGADAAEARDQHGNRPVVRAGAR